MEDLRLSEASSVVAADLLSRYPEWSVCASAEEIVCPVCGRTERRLRIALPSANPSYPQPLLIEMVGCELDHPEGLVSWAFWHDHVLNVNGNLADVSREIADLVEEWTSGDYVFIEVSDLRSSRPRLQRAGRAPLDDLRPLKSGEKIVRCSWTGKHDRVTVAPRKWGRT